MTLTRDTYEALITAVIMGQADAEQLKTYETLHASDAEFRELTAEIENWLAPLNSATEAVDPPDGLLEDIMADIEAYEAEKAMTADTGHLAVKPNVGLWKGLAFTSMAVAALAIGSHFVGQPSETVPETVIVETTPADSILTVMSDAADSGLIAIIYDPKTNRVIAQLQNIEVPSDAQLELWLIRDGLAAPKSLGRFDAQSGKAQWDIQDALRQGSDTLAVSLESRETPSLPTGPQGEVLMAAKVGI